MPDYTRGFTEAEFVQFKEIVLALVPVGGTFDANDAFRAIAAQRVKERGHDVNLGNIGDIFTVLKDIEDLGDIRRLEPLPEGGPHRWERFE